MDRRCGRGWGGGWWGVPRFEGDHEVDEGCWPFPPEVLKELLAKHGAQQAQECRVHASQN
jgi:hypothetical protein